VAQPDAAAPAQPEAHAVMVRGTVQLRCRRCGAHALLSLLARVSLRYPPVCARCHSGDLLEVRVR
jgi:hypothetical protein